MSVSKYVDKLDQMLPAPPELIPEPIEIDPHEDWAMNFVEEEVGRKDWAHNWTQLKTTGDLQPRLNAWMAFQGINGDPQKIIDHVERLITHQAKQSWK